MIYVGIDVSKDKHDCYIVNSDGVVLADVFSVENNLDGFDLLLQRLKSVAAVFKIFCKCAKRGTQRISRARGLRLRACANAATASAAWPWQVAGEMLKWGTDGRPMKVLIPVTVGTISIAFSRRSVKAGVERTLSLRPRMVNRRSACQDT